jgi:hypothetical protein
MYDKAGVAKFMGRVLNGSGRQRQNKPPRGRTAALPVFSAAYMAE